MHLLLYFNEQPEPQRLAAATSTVFSVPEHLIGVVVNDRPAPGTPDRPVVLITHNPVTDVEWVVFEAGDRFAEMTGVGSDIEIAARLCRELRTSALIATAVGDPDQWTLVTKEGDHGIVIVDPDESDEGRFRIVAALQPIAGAPDLPLA